MSWKSKSTQRRKHMTLFDDLIKMLNPVLEDASDKILNHVETAFNQAGCVILERADVETLLTYLDSTFRDAYHVERDVMDAFKGIQLDLEIVDQRLKRVNEANQG